MDRIAQQCLKDLLQFLRDPLTVRLSFFLPLATLAIYGFAIRLESKHIALAVQDFDRSSSSVALIDRLAATNQLDVTKWEGSEPARGALDSGVSKAAVIVPAGFERAIKAGRHVDVQVLVDGSDVTTARVVRGSVRAAVDSFASVAGLEPPPQLHAQTRVWFNPGREEALFIVPGTIALTLSIFPAMIAGINMGREKDAGTIVQAYASSITAAEFLLGKCAAFVVVGMANAVAMIGAGMLVWHIRLAGDPWPLLAGTPIFMAAIMFFGIMLGAMGENQLAAIQAVGTIQPLLGLLLSGFLYPLNNIPAPVSYIAYVVPVRYYIDLMRDAFVRGTGWSGSWHALAALALIAAVEFFAAWLLMRRMQISR
jgi:ABC-2 type transport system permease protein